MDDNTLIIVPKNLKGEDGHKSFSIRIKDELVVQLDLLSQKSGRSRNELISILLRYALEHCRIAEDTDTDQIS